MIKRVYIYLRVSTMMQVDGMSLEGQLKEIEKYCNAYGIEIVAVYSDEGKSGKSIEGRTEFQRMLRDIKEKREIDHVIVWKLSRFGRSARDILNTIEEIKKSGVNLYTISGSLDSEDKFGKAMIAILSSLAEMERENIIEQTGIGRRYKALAGDWNGGQAPYGYRLDNKKLLINPEEAEVVKKIFDLYVNTDMGYNGVTSWLNEHKIPPRKTLRLDRKAMQESGTEDKVYLPVMEDWYTKIVSKIIDCPIYYGKLRWGYETIEQTKEGKSIRKKSENPIIVDGKHEPIISEELWLAAQKKREITGVAFCKKDSIHPDIMNTLNRIAKCPCCGSGMISHREIYKKKNGESSPYCTYICGYYNNHKFGKCKRNAIRAEYLEGAVVDEIRKFIRRPNVIEEITKYMGNQLDTTSIQSEIVKSKKELTELDKNESMQYNMFNQIGMSGKYKNMNPDRIIENLDKINDKRLFLKEYIEQKQNELVAVEQDKLNYESIKSMIENFDKVYPVLNKEQQKAIIQSLVKEVKLGYLGDTKKVIPVSMTLKITGEQIEMMNGDSELNKTSVETVVLLSKLKSNHHIELDLNMDELDLTAAECKATYDEIKA